jgi:hypothetical protein
MGAAAHGDFDAGPGDDGRLELRVAGRLPRDWALRLAAALARRGASLLDGHGRRGPARPGEGRELPGAAGGGHWEVRLVLDPGGAARADLDVGALLAEPPGVAFGPRLLDFTLRGCADAAHLEVHAWDARGLLAGVLAEVEAVGLGVAELRLETEAECAFHHLVLEDPAGGAPDPARVEALARRLVPLCLG